jgi:serine/threonine protein kinase
MRTKLIADELNKVKLPYFVNFEYVQDGLATNFGVQPIVLMDWVEANSLKEYIAKNLSNPDILRRLADSFKTMVGDLHKVNISHGDLQHGNILVRDDGSLILVDYDSMYVPSLNGYKDEIKGLMGYQHPARWKNVYASEKNDYFSELIIYTSIMALSYFPSLWKELKIEDTETLLFSSEDIKSGGSSYIFRKLESHSDLKDLSAAIKKALLCDKIEDLLPLEKAVISLPQIIRDKWAKEPFIPDTKATRAKWNRNN